MVKRTGVVLVWVVATLAATAVALAAVRGVAGQVVDSPGSPLLAASTSLAVAAPATTTTTIPPTTSSTTTSVPFGSRPPIAPGEGVGTTTSSTTSTTAATGGTTPTTAPPATSSTTSTTSTTTTTAAPVATQTQTYQLEGGWVRIVFSPGAVTLDGAGPNPGFTMEIEKAGPPEVELDFESGSHKSRFNAEWSGGQLVVDIEEEPED